MSGKRRLGRTTRMIEEAKRLDRDGHAVYVVVDSRSLYTVRGRVLGTGVKVETGATIGNLDWRTMTLRGAHPNCELLVDHYVIERELAAALAMLHRFDDEAPDASRKTGRPMVRRGLSGGLSD